MGIKRNVRARVLEGKCCVSYHTKSTMAIISPVAMARVRFAFDEVNDMSSIALKCSCKQCGLSGFVFVLD